MQTKFIPLASGLALVATLSLVAAVAPDESSPDEADTVVAQSATTTITLPLVGEVTLAAEDGTSDRDAELDADLDADLDPEVAAYLAAVEQARLEEYLAAVEQAKLDEYLLALERAEAEQAAAERAAAEQAAAEQAAAPAPAPSYAAGTVEGIIARYFGGQTQKALSVARCESSLDPGAMSPGGGNHGLFQINNVHSGTWVSVTGTAWSNRYDAELNTKFAHWLWSNQGWGPWACA
jgi:hypothetical protein